MVDQCLPQQVYQLIGHRHLAQLVALAKNRLRPATGQIPFCVHLLDPSQMPAAGRNDLAQPQPVIRLGLRQTV